MKNLFRLKIKVKSYIRGNVSANTFFGVYCQAYKLVNDEEELRIFLECLADNTEEMTFTDMLKPNTTELITDLTSEFTPHCSINRADTAESVELYTTEDKYIKTKNSFDILCYTSLSLEELIKLSKIVELLGVGSDKSVGSGNIQILSIKPEELPEHTNQLKLLSNLIPDKDTPTHGQIKFITRKGITMNGVKQSAIIQIKSGSTLVNNKVDKPIYGVVYYDEQSDTFINGKAIAV